MKIHHSCLIYENQFILDGVLVFEQKALGAEEFLRAGYRQLALDYPKFFKMDKLCKLAFLGTAAIVGIAGAKVADENLALCFINGQSSLDSDLQHQALIDSHAKVSPSVFVYTLANIMLGEIAIRNKWYGENLVILAPTFDLEAWKAEARLLLTSGRAETVLGGWVDLVGESYRLELYLVSGE